ncbi:MAG: spermidine/putrescine ABC transporter ATP-binding protein, partial [Chloroflexi bacterium]|nr:spermidine/putrescine ABC transporter ATP-binding protein [Chloroflexota bacterium]
MAFLELSNIQKSFNPNQPPAVDGFNLSVEKGVFVSFLG